MNKQKMSILVSIITTKFEKVFKRNSYTLFDLQDAENSVMNYSKDDRQY